MSTELLQQRYQRQIGWTVDKYTIEALLGIGGMAAVFRARHRNGNPVALKVLHAENSLDPDTRARFLREGYTANKVGHQGAVRVLDEGMTGDGTVFLVMELLEGETLDERWERHGQTLSVKDVASISHQILDVLAAAHEKSIVHRDIKPDNIFITTTGAAKILDFGIARLGEAPKGPSMTQTGKSFGTPAYMPPEQALGRREEVDGKTDLWALGATMFAMISGEHVHPAETTEELVVFTATRPARSISAVVPDVPAPIARVVDRALAFAKAERWSDARAMRQALGEAYAEAFGEQIPAEVADPPVATAPVPWPVDEGAKAQAPTIVTMTRSAGGASGASSGRRRLAIAVTAGVLLGAGVLALRVSGTPPDAHAGATASAGAPVGAAIAPALPAVTAPRNDALAAPATSASAAAPIASVATQATSAPRPRPAVHPARPPAPSGAPAPAHDIFKP